ncbi:MAG TPA: SOS response-associated peptidase [Ruminiclostridium sp.]|nr:SOS response-associated peptidase [Ruminiclostridium sp.]
MCAIYKLMLKNGGEIIEKIRERYGEETAEIYLDAQIFPKSEAPVFGDGRKIALLKWGFPIPGKSGTVFNARVETIMQKPMFKSCIGNRCIVPASCFFEWGEVDGRKHKFLIRTEDEMLYFAALFKAFRDKDGKKYFSYTIITTKPNKQMETIHSRMPVILDADAQKKWLDPKNPPDDILAPYDKHLFISSAE